MKYINYDIVCLSETYLNHNTFFDDSNLQIPGYELIRVDQPSNQKRGGNLLYNINNISYLKECLNFNLSVNGKQCNITLIYRSPSQSSGEFHTLLTKFELLLENRNPFVCIMFDNFSFTKLLLWR